ncbi:hypothetical protein KR093_005342 [Drosophila rubida]|uniref:Ubiquitin carboxyl-terminal hydrolase n=1 Tax=Drosophila rubida TaxID=30044 RepID=A0AAD4JTR3_9MUSC|nr:hypothetical protein KR093_005342 [Drosophila rubida]
MSTFFLFACRLLSTAKKLHLIAEGYLRDGDEEAAYISYMKYFNMLSFIHKKPDYTQYKVTVQDMLGDNAANRRTMDKLEIITDSLSKRYEKLQPSTAVENSNINSEQISLPVAVNSSLSPSEEYARLGVISCEELYKRMQQQSVLVMDCRSSVDYANSHLSYQWAFNVPEEIITPGMSAGKLQARLSSKDKASWASRSVKESVVLMDWNSANVQSAGTSPIATLLDILKNWDPDVSYRAPIQILDGGYEYFIVLYPSYSTNPCIIKPKINNNDIDTIDDIEYPSIKDITMKEDILNDLDAKENKRPSINRANKPTNFRIQQNQIREQQSAHIKEIIRDQTALLQRAEENDRLLENASKKWRRLHSEGAAQSSEGQESLYNLLQLENESQDNQFENIRIRDMVIKYKDEVAQADDETTRHIESKIAERQMLDERHERDRLERERLLAFAREMKPQYKPPAEPVAPPTITPTEERPPSPIIEIEHTIPDEQTVINTRPVYDRATKPRIESRAAVQTAATRIRDFSPVIGHNVGRGLTGLKNLGNTCYMNSILQCLANTNHLMDFCVSNEYKKYISYQNKTNGQVIEEVAALIKELWNGQYKCVASRDLRYVVGQYQKTFRGVDQQDSHEFLTILMDWLHSDLQTIKVPRRLDNELAWEKAWLQFTKSQESMILHIFYGQIKSTVKCVTCSKESATYECFSNLSMELPQNANLCQLSQCMDMYFSGEKIYGWNCPKCNTKRDAIKKLDISKLPPVLVVHLKRFYADPSNNGAYVKKQNYVQFPLENLDMKPYIARVESRASTPKSYRLYAVSNHYGTMEGGHYTAFCKSTYYDRWFKFDDQVVSPLDSSNVVSSAAYILFYTWLPPLRSLQFN